MAEVLLFHHAQGLTPGIREFADALRVAGHDVHLPDLYEGRIFESLDQGLAYAEGVGFDALREAGVAAAEGLPNGLVYAGFSLGVMPAQQLAQTRPGAKGALLFDAFLPPPELGGSWPAGVRVQIHGKEADPFFAGEGDVEAARALVADTPDAELFLYAGDQHLFADSSLPGYDEAGAALVRERVIRFLDGIR